VIPRAQYVTAVTLPETDVARLQRFCDSRVPRKLRDKIRVEMRRRGKSVTILERSPVDPRDPAGKWFEVNVAQLRYDDTTAGWTLYWSDRNGRWHRYDLVEPHQPVTRLLAEIEADPTCIFWG